MTRIDAVLVFENIEPFGAHVFPFERLHQDTFIPEHAAIQHPVDVARIKGSIGGILSCNQLWCGDSGAGSLDEAQEMLGVALLWRCAEVRAMRCLTNILDIVDDCNILIPLRRGRVHKPPQMAKRRACQFIGHAVGCVPRNQVDVCRNGLACRIQR